MPPPDTHRARMDHTGIDDDLTAERYVLGKLTEEERHRFEEHFLDCPRCLEAIEAAEGLRDGLKTASPAVSAPSHAHVTPFRPREGGTRPLVSLLAAACIALGISSALFFAQTRAARQELAGSKQLLQQSQRRQAELEGALGRERAEQARAAESLKAAPVFMLNLTRSASTEPEDRVVLPEAPGWVTLIFDRPERRGVRDYRVRVSSADGRPIGEAAPARAAEGGLLAVSLPSDRLPAGDYVLEVEGLAGDQPVPLARYRFRAVGKP
jgi:Putative zinc-finger